MKMDESTGKNRLNQVFEQMVHGITQSKEEINIIHEEVKARYQELKTELEVIATEVQKHYSTNNHIVMEAEVPQRHSVNVSEDFRIYAGTQEQVVSKPIEFSQKRQKHTQLMFRRETIERELKALLETLEYAEQLNRQITAMLNFLTANVEDIEHKAATKKEHQDFVVRIVDAQEEERKRISRDMHDGPAQMLAHVLMRSSLLEKVYYTEGEASAKKEMRQLRENLRTTLIELRRVIFDLRPMNLDDLGITPALGKYLSEINEREESVRITFCEHGKMKRLHTKYEVAIFRIVQECITNSLKHGHPTKIDVQFEWLTDDVSIVVKDDGIGFDVEKTREQSFGLIGMKERVELLDGTLTINSMIGEGTVHIIRIPFMQEG